MAARTRQDEGAAKSKYRYQVKNWAEYDRALVNRGNLTIWFDEASIAESHVRAAIINTFTYLGMPQSVRAGQIAPAA